MLPRILKIKINKKTTAKWGSVLFVVVFCLFAMVEPSWAQADDSLGINRFGQTTFLSGTDIRLIIAQVIRVVLSLLGTIALVLVIYAGFTIMTSQGNEEKVAQGKKILINAVIGLVIILSALAIVQFIINSLLKATGYQGGDVAGKPKVELFAGSGALGKIIKDHYPARNQTGVPRNTKITITFAEPIAPASMISNDNNTCWKVDKTGPTSECEKDANGEIKDPYYGDCVMPADPTTFDWQTHCDHLRLDNVQIYRSADEKSEPVPAAAMASYENGKVFTFVFRPFEFLGNDTEDVWYSVKLTNKITKINGEGAFDKQHYKYYLWEFQTGTIFDFEPPHVVGVYPQYPPDDKVARNTIIQVVFSEPMDPLTTQGQLNKNSDFTNLLFSSSAWNGSWQVSNGYTVTEFVSTESCGQNSCGEEMYCLTLECPAQDKSCFNDFFALIRTGEPLPQGEKFEAIPFSGVMDLAGNALDGDDNGLFAGKPAMPGDQHNIGFTDKIDEVAQGKAEIYKGGEGKYAVAADNYGWPFRIFNTIDRSAPYVEKVVPGLDKDMVGKQADVLIDFSKRLWSKTLADISLEEYPELTDPEGQPIDFFYKIMGKLNTENNENLKTQVQILHREFGPNDLTAYYFPAIPSTVKSLNQNCLYPGRGPVIKEKSERGQSPLCQVGEVDEWGVPKAETVKNCVLVTTASDKDTGCVQTTGSLGPDGKTLDQQALLKSDLSACFQTMEKESGN
ncbi:MAG TPA: hypothetical protein VJB37_00220 [Patescibacteria group bacterium]|nr:hypothetical protein [Patescibacteria group bacterium]